METPSQTQKCLTIIWASHGPDKLTVKLTITVGHRDPRHDDPTEQSVGLRGHDEVTHANIPKKMMIKSGKNSKQPKHEIYVREEEFVQG